MKGVKPVYVETIKDMVIQALDHVKTGDHEKAAERLSNALQVIEFALEEVEKEVKA